MAVEVGAITWRNASVLEAPGVVVMPSMVQIGSDRYAAFPPCARGDDPRGH